MKVYQFPPPDIAVVFEIVPKVTVFHELKDESEWMARSGINPDEGHNMFAR